MTKIAVDIDSTLYDFETPSREAMLKLWKATKDDAYKQGAYHPWTEWRSPADVLGLERWLKAIALCHSADVIEAMRPFDGAVETCQALSEAGHELMYISNRASETELATTNWLYNNGFTDDTTSVVVTSGDKAPFMRDCQYLIDDRLKTCVQFVYDFEWRRDFQDLDRKAFVKGYPYNQAATDIPGLYVALTWAGLNEYLVKAELLDDPAFIPLGAVGV